MLGLLWILGIFAFIQNGYAAVFPKEPRDTTIRNCSITPPFIPPTVKNSTEGLTRLRQEMRNLNISAYIIPSTDPHLTNLCKPREMVVCENPRNTQTGPPGSNNRATFKVT